MDYPDITVSIFMENSYSLQRVTNDLELFRYHCQDSIHGNKKKCHMASKGHFPLIQVIAQGHLELIRKSQDKITLRDHGHFNKRNFLRQPQVFKFQDPTIKVQGHLI